jgi:hypothetical protein
MHFKHFYYIYELLLLWLPQYYVIYTETEWYNPAY